MPLVDRVIAHRLTDEVARDDLTPETVPLELRPLSRAMIVFGERLIDFEVFAPTGEFEAVEAPGGGLLRDGVERQVGPLAGERWKLPAERGRASNDLR